MQRSAPSLTATYDRIERSSFYMAEAAGYLPGQDPEQRSPRSLAAGIDSLSDEAIETCLRASKTFRYLIEHHKMNQALGIV